MGIERTTFLIDDQGDQSRPLKEWCNVKVPAQALPDFIKNAVNV